MKRKWIYWVVGLAIGLPLLALAGWKGLEWYTWQKQNSINIDVKPYEKNITETNYDLIVVGGEPEGVAAAVAGARNGLKTLLIEQRDGLGGLMTYGALNFLDLGYDKDGKVANAGIFAEWHKMVGGEVAFDIDVAKKAFMKLVQEEPNITLALSTRVKEAVMSEDGKTIIGVVAEDEQGERTFTAERFIDSTQDADLAALANVPYFIGGQDIGLDRKMAVTLMIHLKDVNWDGIKQAILTKQFGGGGITPTTAAGFGAFHQVYKPVEPNVRLRGLNIARNSDGSVNINALQIFEVDGLDPASRQEGMERGKRETEHIVKFLRENLTGFEEAKIASYPEELYVRETRHILAEYQLPITDVWENKDQWDSIGFGAYPVDVQATSIYDYGFTIAKPKQYAIPFRSLVPLEIEGILVASRASGYSSLAAGSARIIPTGMTTAEAAGVAAAISIENNISFRDMSKDKALIKSLQQKLKDQGALLYPFQLDYPYQGEWFYPAIRTLLTWGLISGGYDNNLRTDEMMNEMEFVNLISGGMERINKKQYEVSLEAIQTLRNIASEGYNAETAKYLPLNRDKAAEFLLIIFGEKSQGDVWELAIQKRLVDAELQQRVQEDRALLRSEGYQLAAHILNRLGANE